jgi:integrase/recombinase XerD
MTAIQPVANAAIADHERTDQHVIRLWLHGRSPNTIVAYLRDIDRFLTFVSKELHQVTLSDIYAFAKTLDEYAVATQARTLASVKSLIGSAHKIGYLTFDVGRAVRIPKVEDRLAEVSSFATSERNVCFGEIFKPLDVARHV